MTVPITDRATQQAPWRRLATVLFRAREVSILLVVLAVFGLTTAYNTSFADLFSVQQLLVGASVMMILAVGETMVIITRNVDLSVGSVLGLSAYAVGDVFAHNPNFPVVLGFVVGAAVGLLCGVVNGAIVVIARVPSLVVTLGTLYVIRGLDAIFVNGVQINPSSIPDSFIAVGYETILGVPWIFVIAAALVLVVGYVMRTFRPARDLYAIGSDPQAALLAGVPARRRVFFTFVISGTIAGFAGGFGWPSSPPSARWPASATNCWWWPRLWSAGWPSSAAAGQYWEQRSVPSCSTPSTRPWWPPVSRHSGTRLSPERC